MDFTSLEIAEVALFEPRVFRDNRGSFMETWNRKSLSEAGINVDFVQDNHSLSVEKHTLRGLHFQSPPFDQAKLVRVVRGSVLDIAVDIRQNSPTYGKSVSAMLSAQNNRQLFVPSGFAHGFITLEPDTEVLYKVNAYYSKDHDRGLAWDDATLAIDWGLPEGVLPVLSNKDKVQPKLIEISAGFSY